MINWLRRLPNEAKFFLAGLGCLGQAVGFSLLLPEPFGALIAFPTAVVGGYFAYRKFK